MSNYKVKEDYIGDLTDLEPKRNIRLEYYGYLALAFVVGLGVGVISFLPI